ncbi:MAG: cell division protein FtsA [Patescibacteria group bacterium]
MSKEKIIVGLDIGTCNTRVAVAQVRDGSLPQILGVGQAVSNGLRKGIVVDMEETIKSIKEAIRLAERVSGLEIERAFINVGGSHITCRANRGVIVVSRADGEISQEDKIRAMNTASAISLPPNREILHVLPRRFTVDGQEAIKDPVGMNGVKLEVDTLIVEGATPFIKNLLKCVKGAEIEEAGMMLSPLAASAAILNKRQKELGVLMLDLGGGTTGLTVFEEGDIMHCQILPIGGMHITNDLAICLRTSIEAAEKIKLEFGTANPSSVSKKETIDLTKLGEAEGQASRLQAAEIIEARICEILDLVNKELKKIDRAGLLPAGVVLVGSGAKLPGLVQIAKEKLRLPVQLGVVAGLEGVVDQVEDPGFATVCGLIISAISEEMKLESRDRFDGFGLTMEKIKNWIKGFLP